MFTAHSDSGLTLHGDSLEQLAFRITRRFFTRKDYRTVLATLRWNGAVCNGMTTIALERQ